MADDAIATVPPATAPMTAPGAAGSRDMSSLRLTQARAPLEDAAQVLGTVDESGQQPIVVVPSHASRIRNGLVITGVIALAISLLVDAPIPVRPVIGAVGVALLLLGLVRAFLVPVPEGARAVLLRRGRIHTTLGPGIHIVAPGIAVSHIVTTRDTPFAAPAMEAPTRDDVRVRIDALLMFRIVTPDRFVFAISAPDFDQVCEATCREAIRLLVRDKESDAIQDLGDADAEQLRASIGARLEAYGVEAVRVLLAHVTPPAPFIAAREAQRLAALRRAEEEALHALALQRQANREALTRERIAAHRGEIELEAENEAARLQRLEATISEFPTAMRWDIDSRRLDVARALAANPRAMLQVGSGADVAGALLMQTTSDAQPPANGTGDGRSAGEAP